MNRVLLVCSVHRETGRATPAELVWLLGRLRPDVIFLEHSPADHAAFLEGSFATLESVAVRRHRDLHQVELVPVDLPRPDAEFKRTVDDLFDGVERASRRFQHLDTLHRQHTAQGGFAYINSPLCAMLQLEMQREMSLTVDAVGEPSLTDSYSQWVRIHDARELAMLGTVEEYARKTPFGKGILLVGAAHRQTLLEKVLLRRRAGPSSVTWDFDWQVEELAEDRSLPKV